MFTHENHPCTWPTGHDSESSPRTSHRLPTNVNEISKRQKNDQTTSTQNVPPQKNKDQKHVENMSNKQQT